MRLHGGEPVREVDIRRRRAREPFHRESVAPSKRARCRTRADTRQEPGQINFLMHYFIRESYETLSHLSSETSFRIKCVIATVRADSILSGLFGNSTKFT